MSDKNQLLAEFADYDARWKTFIEHFAEQVLERLFPNLAAQRDFKKPITFSDKEFQKIFADWEKKGWTLGDKLMVVPLLNGKKKLVLVHFDVHRGHETSFKELMWIRGYRIRDKYPEIDFTAIAIYIGKNVPPQPNQYKYEYEGTQFIYIFNTLIAKDQDEKELLASDNPLDIAILAMYYLIKSKGDFTTLRQYKMKLARMCFEKGYSRQSAENLFIFVNFTIALPAQEEKIFKKEILPIMSEKIRPLSETHPVQTRTAELVIWGKTMEQRDKETLEQKEKEQVVHFSQMGVEVEKIALLLKIKVEKVNSILSEHQKENKDATNE